MGAVVVRVVVFDEVLYPKGGLVGDWMAGMTNQFTNFARIAAPFRTGHLKASIKGASHQIGLRQVEGTISASASYATFVHDGTHGPIVSRSGKRLGPMGPHGLHTTLYADSVRGQRSQPFLLEAWAATSLVHPCIRGIGIHAGIVP